MGLSVDQMAQMSALLDEALDLDEAGRHQWLERLAPEHRALEAALRQVLLPQESDGRGANRLATLPRLEAAGDLGTLQPGMRVGPYQLERPLGTGGMAEVWLAQRADGAFKREVALKLPTLSRLRRDLADRFACERDILAGLEHPNIARLYDAGVTPEGLPYLAMEYVHGEPITRWCDARKAGLPERLRLFLQVLEAVQFAHAHHVIHRDIKPSNILVSDSGQVRLLDFGVAKLLSQAEERTRLTQLYGRALTPDYASPELIRGDPVDAATDIYELGVVLYELLCGNRPYHIKTGVSLTTLGEAVASAPVERPSTRLAQNAGADRGMAQDRLGLRLRGDLDAIVLKALAKRPEDRYGSAAALADDLHRHLSGQPVSARPQRLSYRLHKFVLRHRDAVAGGTVAGVLIAALAGNSLMHWRHVVPRPDAATAGSSVSVPPSVSIDDKSIAVLAFVDMSERHDQEYLSDGLSEELIARLAHSPDLRVISRTSSFYFKGKAATITEIGRALTVGHVLEGSVRKSGKALRITAQLIRVSDGSHLWSESYDRDLSDIFKLQGDIATTVAAALNVILAGRDGSSHNRQISTEAYSLLLQGNYFSNRNTESDVKAAIDLYQEAIKLDPNYALAWAKLAAAYLRQANYGWAPTIETNAKGRYAAKRAIKIDANLADAHHILADLLYYDFNWSEARTEYERAIVLNPTDARLRASLAELMGTLSGNVDPAINEWRQHLAQDPLDTDAFDRLGWLLLNADRLDDSIATGLKLQQLDAAYAGNQTRIGLAFLLRGQYTEALDAVAKEQDDSWRLIILPAVYWALGRRNESEAALSQLKKTYGRVAAVQIAEMHAYRGEVEPAFAWLDQAYRQRDVGLVALKIDPLLRRLHSDPRFRALLVTMKL